MAATFIPTLQFLPTNSRPPTPRPLSPPLDLLPPASASYRLARRPELNGCRVSPLVVRCSDSFPDTPRFQAATMDPFSIAAGDDAAPKKQPYRWQRVMLKVSGEALAGDNTQNIDPKITMSIAREVASVTRLGIEVSIVVGGGNIFRGASWAGCSGLDLSSADYIGAEVVRIGDATANTKWELSDLTRKPAPPASPVPMKESYAFNLNQS